MNAPLDIPKKRKPDWIRVKAPVSEGYAETRKLMRRLNLATVCEEAACPNIGECWTKKHATVMILGDTCTRACAFCNVKTGMPNAVDPLEPEHVATAAAELGLEHIVITSVDRDDLPDGGASQFVKSSFNFIATETGKKYGGALMEICRYAGPAPTPAVVCGCRESARPRHQSRRPGCQWGSPGRRVPDSRKRRDG